VVEVATGDAVVAAAIAAKQQPRQLPHLLLLQQQFQL
jgi:hypothetical protein